MGATAILMASGLCLPRQVKCIVSDCAFTSPKEEFAHLLKLDNHLLSPFVTDIVNLIVHVFAGYSIDQCNVVDEVKKATVPILLLHGSADAFVPVEMCNTIFQNCTSSKRKVIIEGAAHAESYLKNIEAYENALDQFFGENLFVE